MSIQNRELSGAKHEMSGVMQTIASAIWPLDAKSALFSGQSEICEGSMERQKSEPKEQRSERSDAAEQPSSFFVCLGVQKVLY